MIISNQTCFVDTNVMVYAADTNSPFYIACRQLIKHGIKGEVSICVSPQVLFEFLAVITSPKRVVQPLELDKAINEINKYLGYKNIKKISPKNDIIKKTLELCKKYNIKGQEIEEVGALFRKGRTLVSLANLQFSKGKRRKN
jgi:predicted nucleic acid-binding protein